MKKNSRWKRSFLVLILILANIGLIFYILKKDTSSNSNKKKDKYIQNGKILASQYCQSCHLLPDPSLLPKDMWNEGVFPEMGPFLGINSFKGVSYRRAKDISVDHFPSSPILDSLQWQKIIDYYTYSAPEFLPQQNRNEKIEQKMPFFSVELPKQKMFFGKVSITSYIKIDTSSAKRRIFVNDATTNKFYVLDKDLNLINVTQTKKPIVGIDFNKKAWLACSIGTSLEANNLKNGEITPVKIDESGQLEFNTKPLFNHLARPVDAVTADLNRDGKSDYIISEFGNILGGLSWRENVGDNKYKEHVLRAIPGAISTIVADANQDGLPDIWALFAQGNEGVFLFTNKGNGEMEERQVLKFPPSYGSTSFDLVDFNKDGYADIIYTCGDNGDYTQVLKPYHGVYIFINDGKNNFSQKYFYPINGCYKAIARDFDKDGDLDIACVSFFPAAAQPEEAFVYLENNGKYNFQAYALPIDTPFQKGITIDAGDLDGDGWTDLIIGNGYYNSNESDKHTEPLFIFLRNKF